MRPGIDARRAMHLSQDGAVAHHAAGCGQVAPGSDLVAADRRAAGLAPFLNVAMEEGAETSPWKRGRPFGRPVFYSLPVDGNIQKPCEERSNTRCSSHVRGVISGVRQIILA
jgi:hypothetical protein